MRQFTLTIVAACAVTALLSGPVSAQRRGGGGYGGGYSGGGGRYYGGGYYSGSGRYYGGGYYGGGNYYGGGYNRGWYGGYGNYPYSYGGYYSYYPRYNTGYYYPGTTNYDPGYTHAQPNLGASTSMYGSVNAPDDRVGLRIILPDASARLSIQNQETQATGIQRDFVSPPMDRGKTYTYTIVATWIQNGQPVSRKKEVDVQPGQNLIVDFNEAGNLAPMPNQMPNSPG